MSSRRGRCTKVTYLLPEAAAAGRARILLRRQFHMPAGAPAKEASQGWPNPNNFTPKLLKPDHCLGRKTVPSLEEPLQAQLGPMLPPSVPLCPCCVCKMAPGRREKGLDCLGPGSATSLCNRTDSERALQPGHLCRSYSALLS